MVVPDFEFVACSMCGGPMRMAPRMGEKMGSLDTTFGPCAGCGGLIRCTWASPVGNPDVRYHPGCVPGVSDPRRRRKTSAEKKRGIRRRSFRAGFLVGIGFGFSAAFALGWAVFLASLFRPL